MHECIQSGEQTPTHYQKIPAYLVHLLEQCAQTQSVIYERKPRTLELVKYNGQKTLVLSVYPKLLSENTRTNYSKPLHRVSAGSSGIASPSGNIKTLHAYK